MSHSFNLKSRNLISALAIIGLSNAVAQTALADSMSKSCSGRIPVCEEGQTRNCREKYFYIYAYQYAYIYNGELRSESHSMSTSGVLDGDFKLEGLSGNYIIYDGEEFKLGIPYTSGKPIYVKQKIKQIDGPESGSAGNGWIVACP